MHIVAVVGVILASLLAIVIIGSLVERRIRKRSPDQGQAITEYLTKQQKS